MVLDVLPFQRRQAPRKNWEWMRYAVFALSLLYVAALFLLGIQGLERVMLISFIAGNALYYALGVILAFALKDNPRVLQIPVPRRCVFEARQLLRPPARNLRYAALRVMRKMQARMPHGCRHDG